jgi:dTDP-glucose pyrophosphorylase
VEAINQAVEQFERQEKRITAQACRSNAERFGVVRFRQEFSAFVDAHWESFSRHLKSQHQ